MASPKKIIVVVGATGNQGSSVAHSFLKLPDWHVRCLSRNPSSSASLALVALGAEVVQADLSDAPSLPQAFSNANAIFLNTDFWGAYVAFKKATATREKGGKTSDELAFEIEVLHGKNAAHAAAAIHSLERFVYSALPSLNKESQGKYSSYHADSKGTIVEYILKEEPELARKTSFIYLGGYTTNPMLSPKLDPASGKYHFVVALKKDIKMPIIDPKNSTGPFVRALIEDEDAGTTLLAYDSYLSMGDLAGSWSKASGKEVVYVEVTTEYMHQKFGIPKQVLIGLDALSEFGYMGGINFIEPFQLKKQVHTKSIETWLNERDWEELLDVNSVQPTLRSMEE